MPVTAALLEDGCQEADGTIYPLRPYVCNNSGGYVAAYRDVVGAELSGKHFYDNPTGSTDPRSTIYGTWRTTHFAGVDGNDVNGCGSVHPPAP
jgi:hypothetical protein